MDRFKSGPANKADRGLGNAQRTDPEFREDLLRARDVRADIAFGEQILDIADNTADDWSYNPKSGKLSVNKEAMVRSKIRIEARQFHMSRLHRQTWGEKQQVNVKHDYSQMTEAERLRKAHELVGLIQEIQHSELGRSPGFPAG
jgi:hypothetical protein